MTQQYPFGSAKDRYKKRLFVDMGFGYQEVGARLIEPYSPPVPQLNVKELTVINGPSHIQNMGISSYKAQITLLFDDKEAYTEYLTYCGWTHKFYDEKGHLYLGSVTGMKVSVYEANRRYKVELDMILVKKDEYDRKNRFKYQDIEGHWAQTEIEEMANLGLLAVMTRDNQPILYFRPDAYVTRAEFIAFLNRTRRLLEQSIRE